MLGGDTGLVHAERKPAVLQQVIRDTATALNRGSSESAHLVDGLRAEYQAALRQAEEARVSSRADLPELERRAQRVGAMLERAGSLSALLSPSSGSVIGALQDLDSHLQSAQQARQLGLSVIKAQEEERRRVAREIHDGPAQLLANVVLRIDVCQKLFDVDPSRLRMELEQLKDVVRLSLQDVRKIIFDLRPMALDDLGLIPALRQFLKDYQQRTTIETDFAFFGHDRRFDSTFEVAIFRLVQEALTNVSKHARATQVWVKVEVTHSREIRMSIKDNGAGFDVAAVQAESAGKKFGLMGMKERAGLLGGVMEIQSALGQGTRLGFIFPLTE